MFSQIKKYIKCNMPWILERYRDIRNFYFGFKKSSVYRNQQITYQRILKKIETGEKIKVGFLVNENEKWANQTLYDKLKESRHFVPMLLLTSITGSDLNYLSKKFERNKMFFTALGDPVVPVYDPIKNEFYPLDKYDLDIIFYQQPWQIAKNQNIFHVSQFALPCYIPYCFGEEYELVHSIRNSFHYLLFKEFLSHEMIKQEYERQGHKTDNLCAVGYPKLESYLSTKQVSKKYVIYAPHHSVAQDSIRLGTFSWNGNFILNYAKTHPELNWIFKPHPRCKEAFLKAGIFKSPKELEQYYQEWAQIGKVYETGNYMELFKQSRCLITDCDSFLIEFLPTQSPVINLKRKDSIPLLSIADEIIKTYYQAYNLEELERIFNMVLGQDCDPRKQERIDILNRLHLVESASDNILNEFKRSFNISD